MRYSVSCQVDWVFKIMASLIYKAQVVYSGSLKI
ncbi:uncharacterized protein METZ01_LOCUS122187 [marine metagenome]|uniref:Uncharacterized protein n=1 Tax=marine metagenome TaxID=408172 RepID=A0A381XYN3_9ZZZZ